MNISKSNGMNVEKIILEIEDEAINRLKIDLKKIKAETIFINDFSRYMKKIKYLNDESQQKLLKCFLIDNFQYYKEEKETPLNDFFLNCGNILNKHF